MTPEAQAAIRDSFRKDLPAILEGRDPHVTVYDDWSPGIACGDIIRVVSKVSGVSLDILRGRRRGQAPERARRVIYKLIHELRGDMTTAEMANVLNRERTTVAHGIRMAEAFLGIDPETRRIYREAKGRLVP